MKFSSCLTRGMKTVIKKLLFFIFEKLFGKEVELVAVIYAMLIIKGKKTIGQVPEKIREQVRQVLEDLEVQELSE